MFTRTSFIFVLLAAIAAGAVGNPQERDWPPAESTIRVLKQDRHNGLALSLRLNQPDNAGLAKTIEAHPVLRRIELDSSFHLSV